MRTVGTAPAFARPFSRESDYSYSESQEGMTKREFFAAHALAGLLSAPDRLYSATEAADLAVRAADSLIIALNEDREEV